MIKRLSRCNLLCCLRKRGFCSQYASGLNTRGCSNLFDNQRFELNWLCENYRYTKIPSNLMIKTVSPVFNFVSRDGHQMSVFPLPLKSSNVVRLKSPNIIFLIMCSNSNRARWISQPTLLFDT